jgi:UDP-N-acetylglucosamine 1-carboxyvinyltransferase
MAVTLAQRPAGGPLHGPFHPALAPMEKFVIDGGVPLSGTVTPAGNKNAALPILAASVLTSEEVVVRNVPRIRDVDAMLELLERLGVRVAWRGANEVSLTAADVDPSGEVDATVAERIRASFLLAGPLLARFGRAVMPPPGGDVIGRRRLDPHLDAFRSLGAEETPDPVSIVLTAGGPGGRLRAGEVFMDEPSVMATENALMAAALTPGETVIGNAACEPHVQDLARMLVAMGARIEGIGSERLRIQGVSRLHGATYAVMPDRIETGSYACAAVITGGEVELVGAETETMGAVLDALREAGADISQTNRGLRVKRANGLHPINVDTQPYPGFPTDMQAQFMAMLSLSDGASVLTETIFENRYMHVSELARMGADITVRGRSAVVRGVAGLTGAPVMATDLRASMGLVIAGLAAAGETVVNRVYHLDRGYERLEEKLSAVGADIERMSDG